MSNYSNKPLRKHYNIANLRTAIADTLLDNGYEILSEREIQYGWQFRLSTSSVVNIYVTGKIVVSGKNEVAKKALRELFK